MKSVSRFMLSLAIGAACASCSHSKPPGPTTQPATQRLPPLIKLSADEPWYKDFAVPEQTYTGIIERQDSDDALLIMRRHSYRLGPRTLHPGQKNPVLENLVGKRVEIHGKPYTTTLEGQSINEIWLGSIRPAP